MGQACIATGGPPCIETGGPPADLQDTTISTAPQGHREGQHLEANTPCFLSRLHSSARGPKEPAGVRRRTTRRGRGPCERKLPQRGCSTRPQLIQNILETAPQQWHLLACCLVTLRRWRAGALGSAHCSPLGSSRPFEIPRMSKATKPPVRAGPWRRVRPKGMDGSMALVVNMPLLNYLPVPRKCYLGRRTRGSLWLTGLAGGVLQVLQVDGNLWRDLDPALGCFTCSHPHSFLTTGAAKTKDSKRVCHLYISAGMEACGNDCRLYIGVFENPLRPETLQLE